jgi:hypothetical protein
VVAHLRQLLLLLHQLLLLLVWASRMVAPRCPWAPPQTQIQ